MDQQRMQARRTWVLALWGTVVIQLGGRGLDRRWHAQNSGFETLQDQLQAHWLIWLGVCLTLVVAYLGRQHAASPRVALTGATAMAYLSLEAMHVIAHGWGHDPAVLHVAIAVTWAALIISVVAVSVHHRTDAPRARVAVTAGK